MYLTNYYTFLLVENVFSNIFPIKPAKVNDNVIDDDNDNVNADDNDNDNINDNDALRKNILKKHNSAGMNEEWQQLKSKKDKLSSDLKCLPGSQLGNWSSLCSKSWDERDSTGHAELREGLARIVVM